MANIKSFPNNQDAYIGAEDVMKWLHGRTSGVFASDNNASVSALVNSTMEVQVSDGLGWITNVSGDGVVWWNDHETVNGTKLILAIDPADGVLNRIDRIIVEWKTTNYVDLPEIKVLKGSFASNPVAPSLTNNSTIRQLSLARVNVAAGTTAITASMITDERLDASVCGIVTESVSVDTSMANAQFNELLDLIQKNLEQLVSGEIPDKSITREKFADDSIHTAEIVTLTPGGWSNKKQTVNVNDATADNLVLVAPDPDSHTAYADAGIRCIEQDEGILTFECESVPSVDVLVNVTCFVDGEGGEGEGGGGGGGSVADAVLYTPQELTDEQKAQARENIGAVSFETVAPLIDSQTIVSVNLYDQSLQTPETISPHYWVDGAPYSSTQFDSQYNCTAPIAVEPDTTYTVGLVPPVITVDAKIVKPWNTSSYGVHFFKEDGTFLGGTKDNTFRTPSGTAYFRMNYLKGGNKVPLSVLNEKCMIVLGDTLPDAYSAFGSYSTASLLERLSAYSPPVQYHIANNVLKVASPYKADKDLLVTMNLGRGNGLFDFASFKLMPHGMDIESGEAFADTLATNGTDWHAPFIVRATENADGDDVGNAYFTGGNHQYNNQGSGSTATARSVSLRFFVDGREVVAEKGYANRIEIRWINNVQGYNTRKADGTGREILQERHRLTFDGCEWSETIELEPLEQIFMERWYGLQFVRTPLYSNYRYIGAGDRTLHSDDSSNCGSKDADGIIAYGDEHRIEMTIDTSVDLGKRTLSGETGALCSSGKSYMFIVDYKQMEAGAVYRLCGGYKFMST